MFRASCDQLTIPSSSLHLTLTLSLMLTLALVLALTLTLTIKLTIPLVFTLTLALTIPLVLTLTIKLTIRPEGWTVPTGAGGGGRYISPLDRQQLVRHSLKAMLSDRDWLMRGPLKGLSQ